MKLTFVSGDGQGVPGESKGTLPETLMGRPIGNRSAEVFPPTDYLDPSRLFVRPPRSVGYFFLSH